MEKLDKIFEINHFNGGKLYQFNSNRDLIFITPVVDVEGTFTLDKKGATALNSFLTFNKNVVVKKDGNSILATADKNVLKLKNLDFVLTLPSIYEVDDSVATIIKVDSKELKNASEFVGNNKQPVLAGVNVTNEKIVGTDSFTLYMSPVEPKISGNNINLILMKEFIKGLPDGIVDIYYDDNSVMHRSETLTVIGRLIAGNYPSVDRVFTAAKQSMQYSLSKNLIMNVLECSPSLDLDIMFIKNGELHLKGADVDITSNIDLSFEGKVALNANRLKNALKMLENDEVQVYMGEGRRPILLEGKILVLPVDVEE